MIYRVPTNLPKQLRIGEQCAVEYLRLVSNVPLPLDDFAALTWKTPAAKSTEFAWERAINPPEANHQIKSHLFLSMRAPEIPELIPFYRGGVQVLSWTL